MVNKIFEFFYLFFSKPFRFRMMNKWLERPSIKILDVGCGNHSATKTKTYYPGCLYYGLDKSKDYNNDEEDFSQMEHFYKVDLATDDQLKILPNKFFDCIIMSHVVEHLENGDKVVISLLKKLKKGGIVYIEFPSPHSIHLPSMKGTLNFYDDPSHVRIYSLTELDSLLSNNGCSVIKAKIRIDWKRIAFLPLYLTASFLMKDAAKAGVFWDITGFASYVLAVKK